MFKSHIQRHENQQYDYLHPVFKKKVHLTFDQILFQIDDYYVGVNAKINHLQSTVRELDWFKFI